MSRRPSRIVHVVGTLGGGGVQRLILSVAASPALSRFKHSVVCVEGVRGQLLRSFQDAGIEARWCPFLWPSAVPVGSYRASRWIRQRLAWTFPRRLAHEFTALGATIVHSHISERIDEQAGAAIFLAGVPWVWTIHGLYRPEGRELDRWKEAAKILDEGRGRIMGVSHAVVSDLESRGVRPRRGAVVIHGGVNLEAFSVGPAKNDILRAGLKIPPDAVVIGTVGRLVLEKGYDVLVDAAEVLVKRHVPIRILIAGDGKLRPTLEGEIKRRGLEGWVRLLGYQPDVPGFLSGLDVYVQPSRSEGFGISLLEALAAGLPCVATSVGGIPEILDGDTGVVIPPEDAGSLAEALERLCSPSVRSTVARNAVEVAARHSIEVTARRWAEVYEKLEPTGTGAGRHDRRRYYGGLSPAMRRGGDFMRRLERRVLSHVHWRCREPVLIFESDDWGLDRRASSDRLKALGRPGQRADEDLETAEDLRRLFDVLDRHRDLTGRPAAFTANVIVANPDHEAIARDRYEVYHEIPISSHEDLRAAWREGVQRGVICAELHGRRHFSLEEWMADLRRDVPGARQLSSERRHGGLSLLKEESERYHTEYISWRSGIEPDRERLATELKESLDIIERLTGRRPSSTIAPHYTFSAGTEIAWHAAGLRFIQGGNYHVLRGADGVEKVVSHPLGERSPSGLLYLNRLAKFEPRPERPQQGLSQALSNIRWCVERNIPALIDTHRINYTGRYREGGLRQLDELLESLRPLKCLFLTSGELGEAIEHGGHFHDIVTGKERFLTPLNSRWRRGLRSVFGYRHARLVAPDS